MITKEEALRYHSRGRKGKIEVVATKPCDTQLDLSLAYTPGVAEPCRVIEKDPQAVFEYTARANLVAVVTNGTAVPDEIINIVKRLEPTFGGVNLEDIKAPECFYIERKLKEICDIPVFHDDQHGTAIISGAALFNSCALTGKNIADVKIVFNGAGAAGIACAKHYVTLGAKLENITLCDSKGVVYKGREAGMNEYKAEFAADTKSRTLAEALKGADVFCGVSVANVVSQDMVRSMAKSPMIFAMANPDPEITYPEAKAARDDVIMATGRSDYPNQVNNVLGFPFIFRGALDVRATGINDEMKIAATMALANLAKEPVPESVISAYGGASLHYGPDYIIPKPFDYRVLLWEARAVAEAAMKSGVARIQIDPEEYSAQLEARLGRARSVMRSMISSARRYPKRIVLPEGENRKIIRAAANILKERIGKPVLLGDRKIINERARELDVGLEGIELIDPRKSDKTGNYADELHKLRCRRGMTLPDARRTLEYSQYYALMMMRQGDADAFVSGATWHYPDVLRQVLQIFPKKDPTDRVAAMSMVLLKGKVMFFADTAVNINPTAEELAHITISCVRQIRKFGITPRAALLSYSNFGSVRGELGEKMRKAVRLIREMDPELKVDGEMQADTAVTPEILRKTYPFAAIKDRANLLIFPDLQSGNIAYKLVQRLGKAEIIGPLLVGMEKPIQILQVGSYTVRDIVHLAAYAAMEAQGEFKEEVFNESINGEDD
jgi:malate dehydrogenase (oxaloacetate-decarboxylating)(NADP+)